MVHPKAFDDGCGSGTTASVRVIRAWPASIASTNTTTGKPPVDRAATAGPGQNPDRPQPIPRHESVFHDLRITENALTYCSLASSSREPASTSLENALANRISAEAAWLIERDVDMINPAPTSL